MLRTSAFGGSGVETICSGTGSQFIPDLLLSGKLDAHLAEVDRSAVEMYERLVAQMAQVEGISEELKAADQMAWVGRMNSIRSRAIELVNAELITTLTQAKALLAHLNARRASPFCK